MINDTTQQEPIRLNIVPLSDTSSNYEKNSVHYLLAIGVDRMVQCWTRSLHFRMSPGAPAWRFFPAEPAGVCWRSSICCFSSEETVEEKKQNWLKNDKTEK